MSTPSPSCPACGGELYLDQRGLRGIHRDSCWIDDLELRAQHADLHDPRSEFERSSYSSERALLVAVGASDGDAARTVVTVRKLTPSLRQRSFSGVEYLRPLWRSVPYGHPALEGERRYVPSAYELGYPLGEGPP